ncbi:MAG: YdcH family protein [Alphaproteobacteria bacterium]|nr:YdcH family protein [Alphaproteobacteria bacterium]
MKDKETLKNKLEELRTEHRELDEQIARIIEKLPFDQLEVQRLKRRKLALKDQIAKLDSQLTPDIIA